MWGDWEIAGEILESSILDGNSKRYRNVNLLTHLYLDSAESLTIWSEILLSRMR